MKRTGLWGATVAVVGMLAYCAAVRPEVHADDASDRTDAIAAIDRNLRDIADAIAELPRASSDAPVWRSVSIADEVARNVDRLRAIKGDDSAASRIVDYYPGYLEHFRKTAVALSKLKGRDHSPLAAKTSCEGFQRDLQSQVQPFADKNDPDGLVRIPELVAASSSKADSTWRPVDSEQRDVDAYKSDALYYSDSDGRWNDVHNSVVRATTDLYTAWLVDFDAASKACAEVTAGMKAPFVENAMKSLGTSAASRTQIIKDAEDRLDAAATYLYGSERDSDDSRIASATTKVDEIQSFLSALSYAKGKDQRANHIVDEWPRNIVAFYAAASQLRRLKQWQFTLDTAPTKCAETDRALQDFLDKQADPTSIPAIQAEAARLKADVDARFQSVSAKDREMDGWNRDVKNLQVDDGKWAPVSRNARDSADAMLAYWSRALTASRAACSDLTLGVSNPRVAIALGQLAAKIPVRAEHVDKHDSSCRGVPARGFCTNDDQCLDGTCYNNRCEMCPSNADGKCHPPGTCLKGTFDAYYSDQTEKCGREQKSSPFIQPKTFPCSDLEDKCTNGLACFKARELVMTCFQGGDSRHVIERDKYQRVYDTCMELLAKRRADKTCTE